MEFRIETIADGVAEDVVQIDESIELVATSMRRIRVLLGSAEEVRLLESQARRTSPYIPTPDLRSRQDADGRYNAFLA